VAAVLAGSRFVTVPILYLMLVRLLAGLPLLARSPASKDANQRTGVAGAGISGLAVLFMVKEKVYGSIP
jgi:hypothetical protein